MLGSDVSEFNMKKLAGGKSHIKHSSDTSATSMRDPHPLEATIAFDRLNEPDALLISVTSRLDKHRDTDLAYVVSSIEIIAKGLSKEQIVSLDSTTCPGMSGKVMKPILEKMSGPRADEALAYNLECGNSRNAKFKTFTVSREVVADSKAEARMALAIYQEIVLQAMPVQDVRTAEAVKQTENIFGAVSIAFVNELKVIYRKMCIDPWKGIRDAATKPFGFMGYYIGLDLGGHCIPIDPIDFSRKVREDGLTTRFIKLFVEINANIAALMTNEAALEPPNRLEKSISSAAVLLVGFAYKKNVDDIRKRRSFTLLETLEARGTAADFYAPHIPEAPYDRDSLEFADRNSVAWTREALGKHDTALIANDHDNVDQHILLETVPSAFNTRGACRMGGTIFGGRVVKA